ncbi:MAG TPA: DEAD/DEAH box helicase family protein, partial [Candidatus Limnocylindrales bacterium]|nr:DEAD/DEAH box helicase family protein [Candidatus Limnocylindrales bacterium]
ALFWENHRAGTSGWMPAVAGGWRKGLDRRLLRNLPLTREVMAAHLAGEVFIGLYPLLRDNSCRFLAADFDGSVAMLDALAYAKAARVSGVPAAVELSKSGRGAHVWVFFAAPVQASTARAMGTVLLHEAMVLRGSMDLRSYDRLFPNQDVLPEAGYGNLIAAPLQRKYRDDGLTVFLDLSSLEPYEDQWAYLSTLDRLSPSDAARVARRAKQTAVGSDVTQLSSSTATRVRPRLPAMVRADLSAKLMIDIGQLTPAALATFKHAASMANPKFYELQRLRKSTWDTPRFVRGYDITTDDRLSLPRGLRHDIGGIIDGAGSKLIVTDDRNPGQEIEVAFTGQLDNRQSVAVSALLAHDDGVLVAPPGSGKTVMACAVVAERATSTLILVDRKALADQWRTRIQEFLGFRPGQHGAGRKKLTGVIDIAMLPSLARHADVAGLTGGYGQVVVDECHHLAAAAYDHSVSMIGAQFWLGLTATPTRRDGLGDLVAWQLGPVRHTLNQPAESTLIEVSDGPTGPDRVLYVHETAFTYSDLDASSPSAFAEVQRALLADEPRNAQIVADVESAIGRGRNCLVLTRRVAHLEILAGLLTARGHRPVVMQGGMPVAARRAAVDRLDEAHAGDGVLVIGTTPFVGEGFDAPVLDTLFLAAPISFDGLLVQCAGRVVRAAAGKNVAEVHDYHDPAVPLIAGSLRRRMPGYRALGFIRKA